jgi:hypothetical protein
MIALVTYSLWPHGWRGNAGQHSIIETPGLEPRFGGESFNRGLVKQDFEHVFSICDGVIVEAQEARLLAPKAWSVSQRDLRVS